MDSGARRVTRALCAAAAALAAAACESRAPLGLSALPGERCDGCHGAPPATGAHLVHASILPLAYGALHVAEDLAGAGRYEFGCGHCHPTDPAAHEVDLLGDGLPDVVLAPPAPPVLGDEVKGRNTLGARFDPETATCSGVYCHSSGQETPDYRTSPAWTAAPGALGCGGCHGNPPDHLSAGPLSAAPNSHVAFANEGEGWEWGHYAGLPGPYHGSKHGSPAAGVAAAPITCQTCHFESVDPANTKPGGFYYLDTTGDHALDGGEPGRLENASWLRTQCALCHDGVVAPLGAGRALPGRHVNGRRDVAFDDRAALPDGYATRLPLLETAEPIAPYFMTGWSVTISGWSLPAGAEIRRAVDGTEVLTLSLGAATYDPATRTCASVACHLGRESRAEAGLATRPQWGEPYELFRSCDGCHPMN
jgi:predicted CxxxxCH...CXXCH cytochrome family protein